MRSIETLVKNYPDLTGKEILELQEKDKAADEKDYLKRNKRKLKFIEDINTNGGFYKGSFGLNQYYYYSFTNLRMIGKKDTIYCDVEQIVIFHDRNDTHLFSAEIKFKEYEDFDTHAVGLCERVTAEEYNKVKDFYMNSVSKFWDLITPDD